MNRRWLFTGSLVAALAVSAGAFGAHALSNRVSAEMMDVYETAARYQMYHALGLVAVAWAAANGAVRLANVAGSLFVAGVLLFSGSLYVLALSGVRWWGAVTPLGGIAFIAGWICLALVALRLPESPTGGVDRGS